MTRNSPWLGPRKGCIAATEPNNSHFAGIYWLTRQTLLKPQSTPNLTDTTEVWVPASLAACRGLRPHFAKLFHHLALPFGVRLDMCLLPSGILAAFSADLRQLRRQRWPQKLHLPPLAALDVCLYCQPYCPPLTSALNVRP